MNYMDDFEKEPQLKTRMLQHNFVWGVVHYAALARNGELHFDITDRQVHAGMKASFEELQARADEKNIDLGFVIQPERGSGISGVVETCFIQLLCTPAANGDNSSYTKLIYDANNPVAQTFHENERKVSSPELFTKLADIFLEIAEKSPSYQEDLGSQ